MSCSTTTPTTTSWWSSPWRSTTSASSSSGPTTTPSSRTSSSSTRRPASSSSSPGTTSSRTTSSSRTASVSAADAGTQENGFYCPQAGIVLIEADRNTIQKNLANENLNGIFLCSSDSNQLLNNTTNGNGFGGEGEATSSNGVGAGIELSFSAGNHLENNITNGNETGVFVGPGGFSGGSEESPVLGNTLLTNFSHVNEGDGIFVRFDTPGRTLLRDNKTDDNGDDGIDVRTSVPGGRRHPQQGVPELRLGHRGQRGRDRRRGNRAANNGQPGQCLDVVCKP